jgi:hypothetical protein
MIETMTTNEPNDLLQHLQTLDEDDWAPLWALIPELEATDDFGTWEGIQSMSGGIQMPYFVASPVVERLMATIVRLHIMVPFEWRQWEAGRKIVERGDFHPEDHSLVDCCRLLTYMVRADRFHEGLIGNCCAKGLVTQILKAMKRQVEAGGY